MTRLDHDANVRPWVLAAEDAGATVRWVDVRRRRRDDRRRLVRGRALGADARSSRSPSPPTPSGTITPAAELVRLVRERTPGRSWLRRGPPRPAPSDRRAGGRGRPAGGARPTRSSGRTSASRSARRELLVVAPPVQGPAGERRAALRVRDRDAEPRGVGRLDRRGRLPRRRSADGTTERRGALATAFDRAIIRWEADLSRRFLEGVRDDPGRLGCTGSPTPTASTSARRRSRSACGDQHPQETAKALARARDLRVGRPLLRARADGAARAGGDRRRRPDRLLPLQHAGRGRPGPRGARRRSPEAFGPQVTRVG